MFEVFEQGLGKIVEVFLAHVRLIPKEFPGRVSLMGLSTLRAEDITVICHRRVTKGSGSKKLEGRNLKAEIRK